MCWSKSDTQMSGGEGVSQSPLKDQAFSTFLDQNPPFELRPENGISPSTKACSAQWPVSRLRRVNVSMNMREVTIAYGMTETSPVSFQSETDGPLERRVSTVGRIHPHVEVKVIDLEGRVVPRGEQGELCTRGYSVMLGSGDKAVKPSGDRIT